MPPSGSTRRRALQAVGAASLTGIAGCLSDVDRWDGSPAPDSSRPEVAFDATVLRSFTGEHPAAIRLEFSNETDGTLLYLSQEGRGQAGTFREVRGHHRDSDAELLLLRGGGTCVADTETASAIPETPTGNSSNPETAGDGCWRPPCDELLLYHVDPRWQTLSPDEPLSGAYVLLDGWNEACLPAGTYDFSATGLVARGERTEDGETEFHSGRYDVERRLTVTVQEDSTVTPSTEVAITGR